MKILSTAVQKQIITAVMGVVLCFGIVFSSTSLSAQALTPSERDARIAQILELIAQLRAEMSDAQTSTVSASPEGGFTEKAISVGSKVQTTDTLKVRSGAGVTYNWINNVSGFTGGKVIDGPKYASGYTWWHITYDNGTSGWSAQNWLRTVSDPVATESFTKCSIESSKSTVAVGESFEIDWYTDIANPTLIDDDGERSVSKTGYEKYTATEVGTQKYSIGSSKVGVACSEKVTVVEREDVDPTITLTYPKRGVTFDKSTAGDDIVIKWEAEDVPANTNVIYEIEAVESYAGAFVTGSAGQIKARTGSQTYKIAIDVPGTLDPGEYKVRLSLEECHSLGCSVSYSVGSLKESLDTYDRSSYGYFTIVESDDASVVLKIPGAGDTKVWGTDADDLVTVNYYPAGNIDECTITARYDGGKMVETHPWPNTILSGQSGRSSFYVASPEGVLEEIRVDCADESGREVASDSIDIYVDQDETAAYEIIAGGDVVYEGSDASEAKARAKCSAAYNDEYRGERVQCSWDGETFFDETNMKG